MKILIYADYIKQKSGYARMINDVLPYITAHHEVRFVGLNYGGFPPEFDFRVYPTRIKEANDYWAIEVLDYAIKDFQPDIVFTLNDFYMLRKIAFTLSAPHGHKWVHWGTLSEDPVDYGTREPLKWIDYIVHTSEFSQREISKVHKGLNQEVIYPATNPKTWYKAKDIPKLKKQYDLHGKKVIITCGRNQQRKNIPALLDAMPKIIADIPNVCLILASTAETNIATKSLERDGFDLWRMVKDRKLTDYVLYLGKEMAGMPISDSVLNTMYNMSDVMVHPSMGEGFGMPIMEAAMAGVPTVGLNHSAVTEVVGSGGLLVEPSTYMYTRLGTKQYLCNPDSLVNPTVQLLRDDKTRNALGKIAKKKAEQFHPATQAKRLLSIFDRVITEDISSLAKQELGI